MTVRGAVTIKPARRHLMDGDVAGSRPTRKTPNVEPDITGNDVSRFYRPTGWNCDEVWKAEATFIAARRFGQRYRL